MSATRYWNRFCRMNNLQFYNEQERDDVRDMILDMYKPNSALNTAFPAPVRTQVNSVQELVPTFSLDCLGTIHSVQECKQNQEKETTMLSTEKQHLLNRVSEVRDQKRSKLGVKFGLQDQEAPLSFNELQARLASGMFVIEESKKDVVHSYSGPLKDVRWRDPAVKEDLAGFNKADETLQAAKQFAKDEIVALELPQGLEALKAFQNATF